MSAPALNPARRFEVQAPERVRSGWRHTIRARASGVTAVFLVFLAASVLAEEWFEAYWRGLMALKRRDGARAVEQLEQAIRMRPEPGQKLPISNARRLDYFPYVHLAQARLLTGDLAGARDALRLSEASGREPPAERVKTGVLLDLLERQPAASPPAPSLPERTIVPLPAPAATPPLAPRPSARPSETPAPAPTPAPASLIVVSDPPGAEVYLDDEALGSTDPGTGRIVKSGVAPGPHRIRLSLPGRPEVVERVFVRREGATTIRRSLPAVARANPALAALIAVAAAALLGLLLLWSRRRRVTPPAPTPGTAPSRATAAELETRALGTNVSPGQERFGPFRLLQALGRGGMASVFKVERGGELCALKRPLPALLDDPEFLERFLREAEIGRTLHHPNIIRIFERGDVDGIPYLTMELVAGETLQARIRQSGALAPREAARVVSQVAEALDYAHLKGVVHRDLKPSNIMLLGDGTAKVMDYGIARARRFEGLTATGAFLGTPDYVAPETAEGKATDARSDLYSLGVVFYEALTGQRPFVGDTPFATLKKHCTEPPTPPTALAPGVPAELEAIVLKLLRKDPAERYAGAEELLIELRQYLNRAA